MEAGIDVQRADYTIDEDTGEILAVR